MKRIKPFIHEHVCRMCCAPLKGRGLVMRCARCQAVHLAVIEGPVHARPLVPIPRVVA